MVVTVPSVVETCVGEQMSVSANVSAGRPPYSFLWNDGLSSYNGSPFSYPTTNPGDFVLNVVVTDQCGQTEIGSVPVTIIACAVIVPNVITPNGDGMNDVLVFENLEHFPNNKLVIFNRWGQKLYEKVGYQNDWGGEEYNDGTYFFILELNNTAKTTHKGTFSLLK
jgi:gliding motility-associated-like protein